MFAPQLPSENRREHTHGSIKMSHSTAFEREFSRRGEENEEEKKKRKKEKNTCLVSPNLIFSSD